MEYPVTDPQSIPAWAYKVAYDRAHCAGKSGSRYTADQVKSSYVTKTPGLEAMAIRAFAATIATKEPELAPVDPDERLVANIINIFESPTWVQNDTAMSSSYATCLSRAVAWYKQHKESGQ